MLNSLGGAPESPQKRKSSFASLEANTKSHITPRSAPRTMVWGLGSIWGGSHSSSLPYNIQSDPAAPSTKHGSHGWAIHTATKKTDGGEVTAFQASKAELSKTPLRRNASLADARYTDTSQTQLIPAVSTIKL